MVVIDLVMRIADLSPILALRSLSTLELPYDGDSGLRVDEDADDPDTRILYVPGCEEPVVRAVTSGDRVRWEVLQPGALDEDLRLALAALGSRRGMNEIDLETFDDRVCSIDVVWCLARRVRLEGIEPAAPLVAKLVNLAGAWHRNRALLFDAESPSSRLVKERDRLVDQAKAICVESTPRIKAIVLQEEPRGSALKVGFSQSVDGFSLSGMVVDWAADPSFGIDAPGRSSVLSVGAGPYAVRPTKLEPAVAGALSATLIDGREVKLVKQLKPALFNKVATLFGELGATWDSHRQAYIFQRSAAEVLELPLRHGVVFTRKDFEFFETQATEVRQVISAARLVPGMRVMEPSAGRGALALAAAEVVGKSNVVCHELMPENVAVLRSLGFDIAEPQDFLQVTPTADFDLVLANPPFSGGRDLVHVQHALRFLKPGGRLVAITSSGWRRRTESTSAGAPSRAHREFAALVERLRGEVTYIKAGAFAAVGTDVETCLVVLTAEEACAAKPRPQARRMVPPPAVIAETGQLALELV